ncbi:hypothetical protein RHSIM_Rhsim12G0155200 [Rhododendron simsii]|uniref:Thioredoxin domain-containing protein n=1 Tax=Rhododendron simsii TaxID=118357 RepID=A0A834L6F6_RHOSS|nr:hypothetical protein RHSIM_Rhsim12G0155200 [Rhododendron simsii]
MARSFKTGPTLSGSNDPILGSKHRGVSPPPPSIGFLQLKQSNPPNCSIQAQSEGTAKFPTPQPSLCVSRSLRWWEKTLQPNMVEIRSAQEFVDSLLLAGDRLVIVDFYSPGCGGCKSLHPKIKKFKDALAKHGTDRCDLGPAKGLDESELLSLASIGEISFNLPLPSTRKDIMQDLVLTDLSGGSGISGNTSIMGIEEEVLA